MKTPWREETLSRLPQQFEQLNSNQYIQRKNIRLDETPKEDDMEGSEPTYICESRVISVDDYESYMDSLDSPAQAQTTESLTAISENQAEGGSNQLAVMEAIAELYEMVAALLPEEEV